MQRSSSAESVSNVTTRIGDLLSSSAQTLVNTVNCVGIMGKGIARDFKLRFPDMYADYLARCARGDVRLGEPYVFRTQKSPWIINFPTKDHWRSMSRVGDIVRGLEYLEAHYRDWGVKSLAVPPLGCGNGQLEWRVVGPILFRHLENLSIPVELYAPRGTVDEQLTLDFLRESPESKPEKLPPALIALVEILRRVQSQPNHWPIGRISFQKLAYFATQEGLPTGMHFRRATYGPYSPDVSLVMRKLINHDLIRERPLGKMISVEPGSTFESARQAYAHELHRWEPTLDRLTDLFSRMRTPQAELAATVHFVAGELGEEGTTPTEAEVYAGVRSWKPTSDAAAVASAVRNLASLGRLHVSHSADLPVEPELPDEIPAANGSAR